MPASHPILPDDRKYREIATRHASRQRRVSDEWTLVQFRLARWLLTALTVLALWFVSPTLGKRGVLALAWRFAPRRLRLIAGGVVAHPLSSCSPEASRHSRSRSLKWLKAARPKQAQANGPRAARHGRGEKPLEASDTRHALSEIASQGS